MSASLNTALLVLAPGVPLLLGVLWSIPRLRRQVGRLTPWAALPALLLALVGRPGEAVELSWLLFGGFLGLTPTSQVFLFFTALIWFAAGIHGRRHLEQGSHCERFCVFWLFTLAGNIALIVALDVALFYTGFALMTFAAYGLIVHDGSERARRAGRVYLVLAVLGEALILAGLILAARATAAPLLPMLGELPQAIAGAPERNVIIACLWLGFGVKAGLPLLHFSLPLAYGAAPVSVAAALAGAMIKAGLLGWLVTLPLGADVFPGWGEAIIVTGLFAAFFGALVGVHQKQPRIVLAYSSISQMGLISVAIGAWMTFPALGPLLATAITIYAFHHALAKAALFLGTDVVRHRTRGFATWLWIGLSIPALALAGLMPSGLIAKGSLKDALAAAEAAPEAWQQLPLLLALAAVGTTALMARHLWLLRLEAAQDDAPSGAWYGWALVTAASLFGILLLPLWGMHGHWPFAAKDLVATVWPVAMGGLLAVIAWRLLRPWPVPPADVLELLTPLPCLAVRAGRAVGVTGPAIRQLLRHLQAMVLAGYQRADHRLGRFTEHLWRRDASLLFALLLAVLALAALHLS
ncbi:NADH-ubiquinone oxidoreductase chain M [Thioalkalivibrio nitratireducens DSM 14787]|uniref:NADH-ubiquinone oxidoreductase chain M n=1 Tax=Thioalkalivibrio nitratireducens (strain DSM 14787 / UNIQEM 213 / ALEN2) TaxID=1255043 RepID=L0DQN6_THIND|nr:complex I subunit 5 family protein [Thioalkalivibrio nitratireducens]AGA31804.1 NADH-ubiquinone oxidoreductase chain M [Thioalkalivibrio nitratireducens DSM 14787]